jgi:hypothetical protein
MSKFKVGDRVAVYWTHRAYVHGGAGFEGRKFIATIKQNEPINNGLVLVIYNYGETWVHEKQCRKLAKKKKSLLNSDFAKQLCKEATEYSYEIAKEFIKNYESKYPEAQSEQKKEKFKFKVGDRVNAYEHANKSNTPEKATIFSLPPENEFFPNCYRIRFDLHKPDETYHYTENALVRLVKKPKKKAEKPLFQKITEAYSEGCFSNLFITTKPVTPESQGLVEPFNLERALSGIKLEPVKKKKTYWANVYHDRRRDKPFFEDEIYSSEESALACKMLVANYIKTISFEVEE